MNLDELLLSVQKPGRYSGGEWNSIRKEWTDDRVKVLLAFPDLYEIGMSYLGMKILYGILNNRQDCLCERVFSPWVDFEDALRKNSIRLFSLESRRPIGEFDIIGFSLAYELAATNVLNMLDLGGIPLRSSERSDGDPIVIAGGPSVYNPEPMAEFIDAFVVGDGEDVINEIVDVYKKSGVIGKGSRDKLLRELANIKGVYVPSLYKVEYNDDGTIKKFGPIENSVPEKIEKRVVEDLDEAFYPTNQIVPNIEIVHDRIAIEIMRGCQHACKFCQASFTYRPCRQRSKNEILRLARESYKMTGYDEISLLSLSSVDHPELKNIIEEFNAEFASRSVLVSVPSLRIEDMLKDLPALISKVKKPGLTFAPEAGSERLRKLINKNIKIDRLYEASLESFKSGWRRVKLYFMIGLPTETDDDMREISSLVKSVSDLKRSVDGRAASVTASVNAFIPKPHTPFQREPMESLENLSARRGILMKSVNSRAIDIDFHSLEMSYVEAVISRGDRRLSGVIYESWLRGARFDGWKDRFHYTVWKEAFLKNGIDPDFYAARKRPPEEILPWEFIKV